MRKRKIVALSIAGILLLLQLVRPARNTGPVDVPLDIARVRPMPDQVHSLLKAACYDCHSNNTHYPWYAGVQPVGWWLYGHIREGKEELNFSEFGNYSPKRQRSKLKGIIEQVREGGMPLASYRLLHPEARLTPAEKDSIIRWAEAASVASP